MGNERDILVIGIEGGRSYVKVINKAWLFDPAIRLHMTAEQRGNFLGAAIELAHILDTETEIKDGQ